MRDDQRPHPPGAQEPRGEDDAHGDVAEPRADALIQVVGAAQQRRRGDDGGDGAAGEGGVVKRSGPQLPQARHQPADDDQLLGHRVRRRPAEQRNDGDRRDAHPRRIDRPAETRDDPDDVQPQPGDADQSREPRAPRPIGAAHAAGHAADAVGAQQVPGQTAPREQPRDADQMQGAVEPRVVGQGVVERHRLIAQAALRQRADQPHDRVERRGAERHQQHHHDFRLEAARARRAEIA